MSVKKKGRLQNVTRSAQAPKNCTAKGTVTEFLVQGLHEGVDSYSPGQDTLPSLAASYFISVFVTTLHWTSF